jgi:hypothetical protein
MSIIYRGAYATIIALSGESADAGLPRLGPNVRICPQLTCSIDGKRLVGLMPTLSQLIWVAPWLDGLGHFKKLYCHLGAYTLATTRFILNATRCNAASLSIRQSPGSIKFAEIQSPLRTGQEQKLEPVY